METNKTILEELELLSPFLAADRPGHPYKVPEGYFASFPGSMVQQLPLSLPANPEMPMSVPAGYFEGLAGTILNRVRESNPVEVDQPSEVLLGIGKDMPFSVPSGYFESLDQQLAPVLWNEDAPSVLTMIGRKTPFTVPEGYFISFPNELLAEVRNNKKAAQVYPMSFVRKVYRYAAAAIIIGIVSVGALMYFQDKPSTSTQGTVATVDINTISSDALQSYLTGMDLLETDNTVIASNNDLEADDLKEFLNDMPDKALQQYVQEYAQPNTN